MCLIHNYNKDVQIKMFFPIVLSLLLVFQVSAKSLFLYQPEQIHLAYGDTIHEIVVTWSTSDKTPDSVVEFGIGDLNSSSAGRSEVFVDGGKKRHTQHIHKATLTGLQPNTVYIYHCGSSLGWSPEFWFKTVPRDGDESWQPSLAVFGDMGNENAQSLTRLQEETQRGIYDAILHVGDFAYDMDSKNAKVGDAFMRQIESIAAYVPYMTCPGNHEEKYNFSNYKYRFSMPGGKDSLMYSFDMGPMHIISISTEVYYFINYGLKQLVTQYEWLVDDLKTANLPRNRDKHPWIVVMGHRPMYCSNSEPGDCRNHETYTRVGLPMLHIFGLESLLYDSGVDLEIWAHEHSYERLWPVYDYKVYNGSLQAPYTNPGAPVHVTTGSAGCDEKHSYFNSSMPYWSAFRSSDYGYTRLKAYNKTHLHVEQVSDEKAGEVIDSFWIIKDHFGSYDNVS